MFKLLAHASAHSGTWGKYFWCYLRYRFDLGTFPFGILDCKDNPKCSVLFHMFLFLNMTPASSLSVSGYNSHPYVMKNRKSRKYLSIKIVNRELPCLGMCPKFYSWQKMNSYSPSWKFLYKWCGFYSSIHSKILCMSTCIQHSKSSQNIPKLTCFSVFPRCNIRPRQ